MTLYYLDTCIWLNLFQKEGDPTKGKPYWEIAEEFLTQIKQSEEDKILYSSIVLRELEIKLKPLIYEESKNILKQAKFLNIECLDKDKEKARKLESKYYFSISFYDLVHLSITKRIGAVLITEMTYSFKLQKEKTLGHVSLKKYYELFKKRRSSSSLICLHFSESFFRISLTSRTEFSPSEGIIPTSLEISGSFCFS